MTRHKIFNGITEEVTYVPFTAEEEAERQASIDAQPALLMEAIRFKRNRLLTETDWWVFSDSPEATAEQLAYRQALRDLPANTTDPANPVWPVKPGGTN